MKIPSLESLVSKVNDNNPQSDPQPVPLEIPDNRQESEKQPEIPDPPVQPPLEKGTVHTDTLWNELLSLLDKPENKESSTERRIYQIDSDIVETLAQCRFNKPTTKVINGILRVFIISNLPNLIRIRQNTLFDNININPKDLTNESDT